MVWVFTLLSLVSVEDGGVVQEGRGGIRRSLAKNQVLPESQLAVNK